MSDTWAQILAMTDPVYAFTALQNNSNTASSSTSLNPVNAPPTSAAPTMFGGVFGALADAISNAGNVVAGASSAAIQAAARTQTNAVADQLTQAEKLAGSWFLRGAFFLVGLVFVIIGLVKLSDLDGINESATLLAHPARKLIE